MAIGLVVLTAVLVGTALATVGPDFAQGLYLGLVVAATAARRLDPPWRLAAAAAVTAVSACAAAVSGPGGLLLCLLLACLIQVPFAMRSVAAVTVLPVLAALYVLAGGGDGADGAPVSWVRVGIGTALGALLVTGAALAVRQPFEVVPAPPREAWAYGILLAAGCAAIWATAQLFDVPRLHWSVLAFCLTFVPWLITREGLVSIVLATLVGAMIAVLVGVVAPTPVVVLFLAVGAVMVVYYAVTGEQVFYLVHLTPTVVLAGSLGAHADHVASVAVQRGAAVLAGGALTVLATAAWRRTVGARGGTAR